MGSEKEEKGEELRLGFITSDSLPTDSNKTRGGKKKCRNLEVTKVFCNKFPKTMES